MSHDLRTPIAGIRATLENLIDGVTEPRPELLVAMHERIQRLQRLVEELLDLSQLESGAVAIERSPLLVGDVVGGALDECRMDHPELEVGTELGPDVHVSGDPERLHRVLANLLNNAASHGKGSVLVRVEARGCDRVEISVTDSGPGFGEVEPERLFDRFYRGDPSRTDRGSGLGLAIARWIVELHGGAITACNAPPAGARFTVSLPVLG